MKGLASKMTLSAEDDDGNEIFAPNSVVTDLMIVPNSAGGGNNGYFNVSALSNYANLPYVATITATSPDQSPTLARIYGFTYEGVYYPLPKPSMFLVHGSGDAVGNWANPSTLEQSGVMGREWDFSGFNLPNDVAYWEYEKGDFSIRFDTEAGPFEQILLAAALRAGADRADRSGMQLSGMQLSGMQLSGMQLGVNPNNRNGR